MALSWKYDAWKGLSDKMKHINRYTMILTMCRSLIVKFSLHFWLSDVTI